MSKSRNERRRGNQRKRLQREADERREELALLERELHREWAGHPTVRAAESTADTGEAIPPEVL